MSLYPPCDDSLARTQQFALDNGYPVWNYCSTLHCDENVSYNHQFCYCQGLFSSPLYFVNGQCVNGIGSLITIAAESCYCCCSCFAFDTPIAVTSDTVKAVQHFAVNDPVWVAENADLKSWVQKPVVFSSGTGPKGKNKLIKIHFGDQRTGVTLAAADFVSKFVSQEQSATYFQTLSTAPNNFIGKDGLVNLMLVKAVTPDAVSRLLNCSMVVAQRIHDILSSDSNYLLVTGIQPFLMPDKTLKQAHKLVPGKDLLVRADGSTMPIISLEVGMFEKGVHHIATSNKPATSLDGHLLIANGIVVGDYATQLSLASENGGIADVHQDAPLFGTAAYNELHTHLEATPFSAHAGTPVVHKADSFEAHHANKSVLIPEDAFSYVTKSQAHQLQLHAPIFPASNNLAEPDVRYLFKLFTAFYPEITFVYDQNNMLPNAYSFEQYGRKFVVVNCGWTLVGGLYYQGIAMTIAHLVAALNEKGTLPQDVNPTGKADYDVYPVFLSLFHHPQSAILNYNAALKQLKTVFSYILRYRKIRGKIGLSCRIKTLEASIAGKPLPHCAGGPPDPALEVEKASASMKAGADAAVIAIRFNMQVDNETASALGNYLLNPAATAFSVRLSDSDPETVYLSADIEPGIEYAVVVSGVLSTNNEPMVVGKNAGKFTLKA